MIVILTLIVAALALLALPSALALQIETTAAIPRVEMDLGEVEFDDDGGFHVPLFALATLLGLVATVTGAKNSTFRWLRKMVPLNIPRWVHRYSSIACWTLFTATFMLWVPAYYSDEGEIFHSLHGVLALTTFILAMASVLTGAGMLRNVKRWRLAHLIVSNLAFLFLVITDLTGMVLED